MVKRLLVVPVLALGALLPAGAAAAEEPPPGPATGTPGTPSCYGERVAFGSSQFGITPVDRAGFLGVSVHDFHLRVKASCA